MKFNYSYEEVESKELSLAVSFFFFLEEIYYFIINKKLYIINIINNIL